MFFLYLKSVREASASCIEVLLESGADLTIRNDRDQTATDLYATLKRAQRAVVEPVFTMRGIKLPEVVKKSTATNTTAASSSPKGDAAPEKPTTAAENGEKPKKAAKPATKKPASSTVISTMPVLLFHA
jgi:hypothetical protein